MYLTSASGHMPLHLAQRPARPRAFRAARPAQRRAAVRERVAPLQAPTRQPALQPVQHESRSELQWPSGFNAHYSLGRRIGTGSYGTCYLANDQFGRSCCVKVIPKNRGKQRREKVLRKIAAEADFLLRAQESLGVVQLHGKFEDSAYAYLCTELCSGGDLERLVEEEGPLPEAAVARLLLEILHVVDTCHRAGFVHGDVKPANFVLKLQHGNPVRALQSGSGLQGAWLKAIDFGCSQMVGADGLSRRTGTPVFMSPEIFSRHYSKPADLWSCGMLTYQLLSGRFPFWPTLAQCQAASLEEVIEMVTTRAINLEDAPWLHVSSLGLSLLEGLLQHDPQRRLTASQALQHPWFAEQLGDAWVAARTARPPPADSAAEAAAVPAEAGLSSATDAVWRAAQQVALRLFT